MDFEQLPEDEFGIDSVDEQSAEMRDHMIHGYFAVSAIAIGAALYYLDSGLPPEASYVDEIQIIASIGLVSLGMFPDGIKNGYKYLPSKSAALIGGALIGYGYKTEQPNITVAGMIIAGAGVMSYLYLERQRLLKESKIVHE